MILAFAFFLLCTISLLSSVCLVDDEDKGTSWMVSVFIDAVLFVGSTANLYWVIAK